ncbi:MAG: hypothetical protein WDN47_02320 [Candidatus Doudnabacteria bacterium]
MPPTDRDLINSVNNKLISRKVREKFIRQIMNQSDLEHFSVSEGLPPELREAASKRLAELRQQS